MASSTVKPEFDFSSVIMRDDDAEMFQVLLFTPMSLLQNFSAPKITRAYEYAPGKFDLRGAEEPTEREYAQIRTCLFLDYKEGLYQTVVWSQAVSEEGRKLFKRAEDGTLLLDENGDPQPQMTPSRYIWEVTQDADGDWVCQNVKYADALRRFGVEMTASAAMVHPLKKKR